MNAFTLTLKESREVADGTRLFIFDKPEGYEFQAGQYVALTVPNLIAPDEKRGIRSFSLSSAPCQDEIWFTMRNGESGFKKTFWAMQPGSIITVTKPVGFFTLNAEDPRPVVFLVGGIGITPVRSILTQAAHDGSKQAFTLFYANRFLKDAAYHDEIGALDLPGLKIVDVLSQSDEVCTPHENEHGYICEEFLSKHVDRIADSLYYIVGSPDFITAMETMVLGLGVPKEQIKKDPFTGLTRPKTA